MPESTMMRPIGISWRTAAPCSVSLFFCLAVLLCAFVAAVPECLAQPKPAPAVNRDSVIAAAREIMGMQTYCALITVDSSGHPHARTMNPFPPEADMTVWIATNTRSRKVQEIRNNPRVSLYYADHNNPSGYVSISGRAVLVEDAAEKTKRKRAYWDQAFPDWKYLILIKVVPDKLEVLNYGRGMLNDSITWETPFIGFAGQ